MSCSQTASVETVTLSVGAPLRVRLHSTGGKAFHEIWEYAPRALGFKSHWEEDPEGGFEEAFDRLKGLIDQGIPIQAETPVLFSE